MWDFIKKEDNARALAIVVPLFIAITAGAWAVFTFLIDQANDNSPIYSIYLDSTISPFEEGYVKSYSPPYIATPKGSNTEDIWYLRRNHDFLPHSLDLYFAEISTLSKQEILQEIANIPANELLHETILAEGFYNIMVGAGKIIDRDLRNALAPAEAEFPALAEFLGIQFGEPGSTAAYFMYQTDKKFKGILKANPDDITKEMNNIWPVLDKGNNRHPNDNLTNCLLLKQYNPVFLLAISNTTDESVIVSDLVVDAERIGVSSSGMKSGFLEVMDTIVIPLRGQEKEKAVVKLKRPLRVVAGDTASIRMILDSELMFIYKIAVSVFDGSEKLHQFEPFIVDYFSEI